MKKISMKNLQRWVASSSALAVFLVGSAFAAGGDVKLKPANVNMNDKASLQRGAKLFTDYCLSCHSAKFVRFNRVAEDLDLTEEQVMNNLNNIGAKFGSTMNNTMTKEYAKQTFGAVPPDLSLVGRSRGSDWLYTYMTGFYADSVRPTGFNNVAFKDVGMPNVMWQLQGTQKAVIDDHGKVTDLQLVEEGSMSKQEFDVAMRDLVNFLAYMSEPRQEERKIIGIWVLLFLSLLFVLSYALKKEYWKDVPH